MSAGARKRKGRSLKLFYLESVMFISYIDPGSGAMLLQWIIAVLLGSGLMFRQTIRKVLSSVFRRNQKSDDDAVED